MHHWSLRRWVLGNPFRTSDEARRRLPKVLALPVFASDALSSVAYGTQEIVLQLALAGAAGLAFTLPVSLTIVAVLALVTLSYQQTIHAYPGGGGSYSVSRANLSVGAGLVAAAALLTDYVLTVAVSVAAGVQQITSMAPSLAGDAELLCVLAIAVVTVANLRGARESGRLFAVPTYVFIAAVLGLVVGGIVGPWFGFAPVRAGGVSPTPIEAVSVVLMLRAFASGCSALTGIEAISNGVQAFEPPEARNAGRTLVVMSVLLAMMFVGCSYLTQTIGVVYDPTASHESLLSLLARAVFHDNHLLRGILLSSTAAILLLAANTAFADFPRLGAILARDGYAPRQLTRLGDRLVFSNGIVLLGGFASLVVIAFRGQTDRLIPLYAVGVFLAFTLSQAGMVRHWMRERGTAWRWRALANGLGCAATATALAVISVEKATAGAWVVMIIIPCLVWLFRRTHRYYAELDQAERVEATDVRLTDAGEPIVVVLASQMNRGLLAALAYARRLATDCRAVHVAVRPDHAAELTSTWREARITVPLVILDSPYRSLLRPLREYVTALQRQAPGRGITIVMPTFVSRRWWEPFLHHNAAFLIRWALLPLGHVVVVEIPYEPTAGGPTSAAPATSPGSAAEG